MPTKIQVVSALYKSNAKDVTILAENSYNFFYKSLHMTLIIDGNELLFTAKRMRKGAKTKSCCIQGQQSLSDKIKKGLKNIDNQMKETNA